MSSHVFKTYSFLFYGKDFTPKYRLPGVEATDVPAPRNKEKNYRLLLIILLLMLLLAGCNKKRPPRSLERSFYYWKSTFKLGKPEQDALKALHINRLYVKFFDIAWNDEKKEPLPLAIIKFPQKPANIPDTIIPTAFITNDCMQKMSEAQVIATANKILLLIKNIASSNGITVIPEIQMDCDWNAGTKDRYFLLLQTIKNQLTTEKKILSATIRLYQYKYYKKMGTPPVDRGLLMCYNMGNLKNPDTRNSILEVEELKKYLAGLPGYSLPLDIALPIFSWKVLFRNKKFAGLISELPTSSLKNNSQIKPFGNKYEILHTTVINGYTFQTADVLRDEEITFDELVKAADILNENLISQQPRVVLYHLDSITLSKFSIHELETIFDHLH